MINAPTPWRDTLHESDGGWKSGKNMRRGRSFWIRGIPAGRIANSQPPIGNVFHSFALFRAVEEMTLV